MRRTRELEDITNRMQNMGAKSSVDFKRLLRRRFGNMWRAWRIGLKCDACKKLSFTEFCQACRGVGFHGTNECY